MKARETDTAALGKAWTKELPELDRTLRVRGKPVLPVELILKDDKKDRA